MPQGSRAIDAPEKTATYAKLLTAIGDFRLHVADFGDHEQERDLTQRDHQVTRFRTGGGQKRESARRQILTPNLSKLIRGGQPILIKRCH